MSSLNSYQETDLKIDFHNYWGALKRRKFWALGVFAVIFSSNCIYVALKDPVYESIGSILIAPKSSSFSGIETPLTGELESLGKQSDPLITETEIIRSHPVLQETAAKLSSEGYEIDISNLEEKVEVEPLVGTDMLSISYQAPDSKLASTVAKTLIDVYMEINVRNNRAKVSASRDFIEAQLPKTAKAVQKAEQELRAFKEQNQIVTLAEQGEQNVAAITNLESLIAEAKVQLASLESQPLGQIGNSEQIGNNNRRLDLPPHLVEAAERLGQIQSRIATERNRFHFQHPAIASLEKEEAQLKAQIQQIQLAEVKARRQSLEKQINKLSELRNARQATTNNYPKLEQTERGLERNLSAAQVTYESCLLYTSPSPRDLSTSRMPSSA